MDAEKYCGMCKTTKEIRSFSLRGRYCKACISKRQKTARLTGKLPSVTWGGGW